jgi:hypothetical protein
MLPLLAVLATVGAAGIAAVGAFVAVRTSASINVRGQAELERQKGRREWRRANVQPFLDLGKGRSHAYRKIIIRTVEGDAAGARTELGAIGRESHLYRDVSYRAVTDVGFRQAAERFDELDIACKRLCLELIEAKAERADLTAMTSPQLGKIRALTDVYADLDRAAEAYIFDEPRRPWWRFW